MTEKVLKIIYLILVLKFFIFLINLKIGKLQFIKTIQYTNKI